MLKPPIDTCYTRNCNMVEGLKKFKACDEIVFLLFGTQTQNKLDLVIFNKRFLQ